MKYKTQDIKAIIWMIIACVMAAVMITLVRYIGEQVRVEQVVCFRYVFALMFFLPWVLQQGTQALKTAHIRIHIIRSLTGLAGMFLWFYVLMKIPLTEATALSFTAPILTGVLAVLWLGETMGVRRSLAMAVAFIGVLVILQPGTALFSPYALLAVFTAFLWAISGVLIKKLSTNDKPELIAFYMVLLMTPVTLPIALYGWEPMSASMWGWLVALGLVSNLFQVSLSRSIALADLVVTMPFDFFRLIFVALFAYIIFEEEMGWHTLLGAVLILSAAVYTAYRKKVVDTV